MLIDENQDIQMDWVESVTESLVTLQNDIQNMKASFDYCKGVIRQLCDAIDKINPEVRRDIFA